MSGAASTHDALLLCLLCVEDLLQFRFPTGPLAGGCDCLLFCSRDCIASGDAAVTSRGTQAKPNCCVHVLTDLLDVRRELYVVC